MLKALTIFSGNANRELAQAICRYVETPLGRAEVRACPKVKVLSVARLLGEAVKRIHHGDSISSLFI